MYPPLKESFAQSRTYSSCRYVCLECIILILYSYFHEIRKIHCFRPYKNKVSKMTTCSVGFLFILGGTKSLFQYTEWTDFPDFSDLFVPFYDVIFETREEWFGPILLIWTLKEIRQSNASNFVLFISARLNTVDVFNIFQVPV